jgi:hypothetical protein
MAERAYAVYLKEGGPDVYIANELTDDPHEQRKCPIARHVITAQNGSNIYALGGAIGKGFRPLEHPPTTPIQNEDSNKSEDVGEEAENDLPSSTEHPWLDTTYAILLLFLRTASET